MPFCEENQEDLCLYVAGELKEPELLDKHLAECPDCRGQVEFLRGFRRKVREAEEHSMPAEVQSRLAALIAKESSQATDSGTDSKVVKFESRSNKVSTVRTWTKILSVAAVFCLVSFGFIQIQYRSESPTAVASLVEHHDTCWHIRPSEGRDAQFQEWVDKLGEMPPAPTVSEEVVAFDKRECPAGEVRAGHLLYNAGEQKLSVYILPAESFMRSYGADELKNYNHDGRSVVLKRKGDWVYGAVAKLPVGRIEHLVDTEHLAMLEAFLAQSGSHLSNS